MRSCVIGLFGLLIAACAAPPSAPPSFDAPPPVTPDGLARFDSEVFELVYVKPGLDLSAYDKIQIRPISIGYKAEPRRARLFAPTAGNFALSDAQRTRISRAFSNAFSEAMTEDDRFRLVASALPGALQFKLALAQLELNIPPREAGAEELIEVDKVGELTLVVDVSDAATGEPLVRGRDTFVLRSAEDGETREQLRLSIGELFTRWSRDIRRGVDRLSAS